ncbi:MAG: SDR family oxidoreductase [Desulfobacterales bacterium]|nr:MAG: SDR family oxidoreductase [Desulfobacterales bacterium]
MKMGLKEKSVLVLASSEGIGKATALEFAKEESNVMLFGRSEEKLLQTQAMILNATGRESAYTVGDMTRYDDIRKVISQTSQKFGPIYALVNNTGGPPAGHFEQLGDEDWQKAFDLTLLSFIRSIREVIPFMKQAGGGRIVNIASSSVKRVIDNLILSNTFRMGVMGLTKTLSRELGQYNILINVIGPGKIETERVVHLDEIKASKSNISIEQLKQNTTKEIPLGRYGSPEELAQLAVFLCSAMNTYITGQTILVDGGMVRSY